MRRRILANVETFFRFDDYELDPNRLELRRQGKPVRADPLIVRLLAVLVRSAGRLVTKDELFSQVWDGRVMSENVLTVAMVRLRKVLGHEPGRREFINNVRGLGYRFVRTVTSHYAPVDPLPAARIARDAGEPLFGREAVMNRLRTLLNEAREGRGHICVLTGEPGIGKTRAAEWLAREAAAAGSAVAWGYCHETGDTPPLWPFVQLLRQIVGHLRDSVDVADLLAAITGPTRVLPELDRGAGQAAPFVSVPSDDHPWAKHRIFDRITRVLGMPAPQRPWVLIVDDLHRADAASLELVHYWADEIAAASVLLVATARTAPAPPGGSHLAHVLGHRNCSHIALAPLREVDVAEYVTSVLDDADSRLANAVYAKSEGNPFFMVELTRQLHDADRADPAQLEVPRAALDRLQERVSALPDAVRECLSCAAVIGRTFELALLQVVADCDAATVTASLDEAIAGEIVVAAPDSRTAFAFAHELFRQVSYERLTPADRRRFHLRVTDALEERARHGVFVAAPTLAHHTHAALPLGDLARALEYGWRAAIAAARTYGYADAVRYLRYAREALELMPQVRPDLRLQLMLQQALWTRISSPSDFEPLTREIIELARQHNAGQALASAALLLDLHAGFPAVPGSREALEGGLAMLPVEDPLRGAVLARLATAPPAAYDAARSTEQAALALAMGQRSDSLLAIYHARAAQLYLGGGPAHAETSAAVMTDIVRMCAENPSLMSAPPVLLDMHRAITSLQRGDSKATAEALARAELVCRKLDHRDLLWHVQRFQELSCLNAGQIVSAGATLHALHSRAEREGVLGTDLLRVYDRVVVLGDTAAVAASPLHLALVHEPGDPPNIWSIKVRTLVAAGFVDEARGLLETVPAGRLCNLPCDRDYLGTLGALARVVIALRAFEYARAIYSLLSPYPEYFAAHVSFFCEGSVSQLLAGLARLLGDQRRAIEHLETALACAEAAGLAACANQARLELAACGVRA